MPGGAAACSVCSTGAVSCLWALQIAGYLDSGEIKIQISKVYPFAQAKCVLTSTRMHARCLSLSQALCAQGGLRGVGHVACQGQAGGGGRV